MGSTETQRDERPEKPSEYTFRDYRHEVEIAGEVALDAMRDCPEDNETLDDAVWYAIEGSTRYINYGHMLMTVLLSDQNPDVPDYCAAWHHNVSDPERWASAVQEMARVCYYSDVYDWCVRQIEAAVAAEAGL